MSDPQQPNLFSNIGNNPSKSSQGLGSSDDNNIINNSGNDHRSVNDQNNQQMNGSALAIGAVGAIVRNQFAASNMSQLSRAFN